MTSDYWRSEVRIRDFVTLCQYSVSKQSIVNLWRTKLAALCWTGLLFPNKEPISWQTFQGKIYLIQNKFVQSTLYTCLILKYHCVFVCVCGSLPSKCILRSSVSGTDNSSCPPLLMEEYGWNTWGQLSLDSFCHLMYTSGMKDAAHPEEMRMKCTHCVRSLWYTV